MEGNDGNNDGKTSFSIKATKSSSPTRSTKASSIPPKGVSFVYIETNGKVRGESVFVSFERTDVIQNSNISFFHKTFLAGNIKALGRFRNQLLSNDNT